MPKTQTGKYRIKKYVQYAQNKLVKTQKYEKKRRNIDRRPETWYFVKKELALTQANSTEDRQGTEKGDAKTIDFRRRCRK